MATSSLISDTSFPGYFVPILTHGSEMLRVKISLLKNRGTNDHLDLPCVDISKDKFMKEALCRFYDKFRCAYCL